MNILVLGAGAVGQVYAYHLHKGGARVAFFAKEKYAEGLRAGLTLYPLKNKKDRKPVRFEGARVLTALDEVRAETWDQLWLCISSTALRQDWLDPMLEAVGEATVVSLQPGLEDRDYLLERLPESRLINGAIGFASYPAPLAGSSETVPEPGMAYHFQPMTKSPFSGPREAVDAIVDTLKKGQCPAKRHKDAPRWAAAPSAIMMPHLVALEASDWKLDTLRKNAALRKTAAAASREAIKIASHHHKARPPFMRHFVRQAFMRFVLWVAPKAVPYDFETYIQYHFTKVGDQTRLMMQSYIERGKAASLETQSISDLLAALPD